MPKKYSVANAEKLFLQSFKNKQRGVRVVEGARLESVYTATYRGFESLPLCIARQSFSDGGIFFAIDTQIKIDYL